jgi:methylglutamate dehydrogenase subunit A
MSRVPAASPYVVIGAGVHGLSTAWHLARELAARGRGDGSDVLVVDKHGIGAGASGIACGVIRNNYFQPAMRELMAHSVELWESDPEAFAYHPVGYMQLAPEVMAADVAAIHEQQQAIGYASVLVEGETACRRYMRDLFDDWQAERIAAVLHEQRGGYANNVASMQGLARKAQAAGVQVTTGVEVTGFAADNGAVTAVETTAGRIACEQVVVAVGPWIRDVWALLDLPARIDVHAPDGTVRKRPMWSYWLVQEGTLDVDPAEFTDSRGAHPPVLHVDNDAPLADADDGGLVTDELWGVYYKPDFNFGGVQGGATPRPIDEPAEEVDVEPYGPPRSRYSTGEDFMRLWTSALAHCHKRFEGQRHRYRQERSGGIGAFTPDSFPVFDVFRDSCYVIADSNHGYKMLGVGALVAKELLGEQQALLAPFRFDRYERGALHPTSHSPFPWS